MRRMLLEVKEAQMALSPVVPSAGSSPAASCRIAAFSKEEIGNLTGDKLEKLYRDVLAHGDPTAMVDSARTLSVTQGG